MKIPEKRDAATVSATKKYTTRRVVPDSWENYRHHYISTFRAWTNNSCSTLVTENDDQPIMSVNVDF